MIIQRLEMSFIRTEVQKEVQSKQKLDEFLNQVEQKRIAKQESQKLVIDEPDSENKQQFKIYNDKPIYLSFKTVFKNYEFLNKYLLYKLLVKPLEQNKPDTVKETMTREELYIIHDIYHDYDLQLVRASILAGMFYPTMLYTLGKFVFKSHTPLPLKFLIAAPALYYLRYDKIKEYVLIPRINYYYRLFQVGDQYKLGNDTLEIIKFVQDESKDLNKLSKENQFLYKTSWKFLISYYKDQIYNYEGVQEKENDLLNALFTMISIKNNNQHLMSQTDRIKLYKSLADNDLKDQDKEQYYKTQAQIEVIQAIQDNQTNKVVYEDIYKFLLDQKTKNNKIV
ncbi:UNKNOWN [Stylonychia lemnae]|uniref:Uncharacterized protein n=1 Tax=Stylonychia lemnae TaxID=5949 RepID=A0A078AUV9_STYLE|nr:UNKNOWN [Stylonychia lemnae]|eukprot:CDW86180.1 UNKNOWN [Stylonychia lemnae]